MSVALLPLGWWSFPYLRIQRIFLIYFYLDLKRFLNVCYPFFSVMLLLWFKWYIFSQKITEHRLGTLLEICDKTIIMSLAKLFFSAGLKEFGKFHNHTVLLWKTQWVGSFAWKVKVCTTKVMNFLKFGKVMKIKHSATLPPDPYNLGHKCMGGVVVLHGGLMIRSC